MRRRIGRRAVRRESVGVHADRPSAGRPAVRRSDQATITWSRVDAPVPGRQYVLRRCAERHARPNTIVLRRPRSGIRRRRRLGRLASVLRRRRRRRVDASNNRDRNANRRRRRSPRRALRRRQESAWLACADAAEFWLSVRERPHLPPAFCRGHLSRSVFHE